MVTLTFLASKIAREPNHDFRAGAAPRRTLPGGAEPPNTPRTPPEHPHLARAPESSFPPCRATGQPRVPSDSSPGSSAWLQSDGNLSSELKAGAVPVSEAFSNYLIQPIQPCAGFVNSMKPHTNYTDTKNNIAQAALCCALQVCSVYNCLLPSSPHITQAPTGDVNRQKFGYWF